MASKRRELQDPYDELRRRAGITSDRVPVRIIPGFLAPSYVRERNTPGRNYTIENRHVAVGYDWLAQQESLFSRIIFQELTKDSNS